MQIKRIIVHCSDSAFGSALLIDKWHRAKGWDCIGYQYVILNGYPKTVEEHIPCLDGMVEVGRYENVKGAGVKGYNMGSIHICMIGKPSDFIHPMRFGGKPGGFTHPQLVSLRGLIKDISHRHGLKSTNVFAHNELDSGKTCPGYTGTSLRTYISTGEMDMLKLVEG